MLEILSMKIHSSLADFETTPSQDFYYLHQLVHGSFKDEQEQFNNIMWCKLGKQPLSILSILD